MICNSEIHLTDHHQQICTIPLGDKPKYQIAPICVIIIPFQATGRSVRMTQAAKYMAMTCHGLGVAQVCLLCTCLRKEQGKRIRCHGSRHLKGEVKSLAGDVGWLHCLRIMKTQASAMQARWVRSHTKNSKKPLYELTCVGKCKVAHLAPQLAFPQLQASLMLLAICSIAAARHRQDGR